MKKNNDSQQQSDLLSPGFDDLFLASARQDLARIEQALNCHDYCAMRQTVHRLKGAAMIFRVTAIVNPAQRIEAVLNARLSVDQAQLSAAWVALRQQIDLL